MASCLACVQGLGLIASAAQLPRDTVGAEIDSTLRVQVPNN